MKVSVTLIPEKDGVNVFKLNDQNKYDSDDYLFTTRSINLKDIEIIGCTVVGELISIRDFDIIDGCETLFFNLEYAYSKHGKILNKLLYNGSEFKQASYKYDYAIVESNANGTVDIFANILENDKLKTYNSLYAYNEINKENQIYKKSDGIEKTFIHVRHGIDGCLACNLETFKVIKYFKETPNGILDVYSGELYEHTKTLEQYAYGLKNDTFSLMNEFIRIGESNEW